MNERIEAFIDQMSRTGLPYQAGDRELTVTGSDLEYFAELIVKECISINRQRLFSDYEGDSLRVAHNNALLCANFDMFDHFGVGE